MPVRLPVLAAIVVSLPLVAAAPGWTARHARFLSPPPPPPLDKWTSDLVARTAESHGLNASTFQDHNIDGIALHEMERLYSQSGKIPNVVDISADKAGPKLRFLRILRKWATVAEAPAPLRPPPPPMHPVAQSPAQL